MFLNATTQLSATTLKNAFATNIANGYRSIITNTFVHNKVVIQDVILATADAANKI